MRGKTSQFSLAERSLNYVTWSGVKFSITNSSVGWASRNRHSSLQQYRTDRVIDHLLQAIAA